MRYLSVCSGIEAATVAWAPMGWRAAAYSEIEPFPCAALKHHYPETPNWGDMTKFKDWPDDANISLLVGGTPCQSFSVAGFRKGLADPRGNLALIYFGIADRYRPTWLVWENVPGVLSSNGGRDFGAIIGAMVELGYHCAWRVLDAQYYGVPQRRRRVFVVGHLGARAAAAAVLFELDCLRRTSPPSRSAGKEVAPIVIKGAAIGREPENGPQYGEVLEDGSCYTLNCVERHAVATHEGVRFLTPRECERAQGFPDDYTLIPWRGGLAPDDCRYVALGNSMAVPVMRWLGRRIALVDRLNQTDSRGIDATTGEPPCCE